MCRNHRGFIEATVACSKLGASALYLNTAFAGPQIADVLARESAGGGDLRRGVRRASSREGARGAQTLRRLGEPRRRPLRRRSAAGGADRAAATTSDCSPPAEPGRVVILTSGTTGTPKGAARKQPDSLEPAAALFSKIPLRARETTMIAAPMFHSWGFAHFTLALPLASTLVLRRTLRPRGHAARGRPAPRERARGRAGDAAADPRAAARRRSRATTCSALRVIARQRLGAAGRAGARARWTRSATCSTTSTARPRWRGRRSPRRRTCARRPAPPGARRWGRS